MEYLSSMISPWKNSCVVCKNKQMYEYYLSVGNWKANMKVIIILLTTFALVATLSLAQSTPPTLDPASLTSICSEEKSFTCPMSNERYVEYVMPMDRSTETDRCPRRPQKIKKLIGNNKMIPPSQNRACHSSVVIINDFCSFPTYVLILLSLF